jgi:hypothetical protein
LDLDSALVLLLGESLVVVQMLAVVAQAGAWKWWLA